MRIVFDGCFSSFRGAGEGKGKATSDSVLNAKVNGERNESPDWNETNDCIVKILENNTDLSDLEDFLCGWTA